MKVTFWGLRWLKLLGIPFQIVSAITTLLFIMSGPISLGKTATNAVCALAFQGSLEQPTFHFPDLSESFNLLDGSGLDNMPSPTRLARLFAGSYDDRLGIKVRYITEINRKKDPRFGLHLLVRVSGQYFDNLPPEYPRPPIADQAKKFVAWLEYGHIHVGYILETNSVSGHTISEITNPLVKLVLLRAYSRSINLGSPTGSYLSRIYGKGLSGYEWDTYFLLWRRNPGFNKEISEGISRALNPRISVFFADKGAAMRFYDTMIAELDASFPDALAVHSFVSWLTNQNYDDTSGPRMDTSEKRKDRRFIVDASLQNIGPEVREQVTRLGGDMKDIPYVQLDFVFRGIDSYLVLDRVMALVTGDRYHLAFLNSEEGVAH